MTFPQNWPDVFVKSCRSWEYLSAHSARFLALVPAEGQVGRLAQALAHPGLLRHPGRSFLRRSQLAGTANVGVNGRLRLWNLVPNHILKKWKRLNSLNILCRLGGLNIFGSRDVWRPRPNFTLLRRISNIYWLPTSIKSQSQYWLIGINCRYLHT